MYSRVLGCFDNLEAFAAIEIRLAQNVSYVCPLAQVSYFYKLAWATVLQQEHPKDIGVSQNGHTCME